MNTPFYRPVEGDTAGVVADGYQRNFDQFGNEIATGAQAIAEALATKVDKIEGHSLMSSEEHDKLAGIENGANAYIHPGSHPADMISDTPEKVVMTVAEREKLEGIAVGANAYNLPAASPTVLGGVKVGRNLSVDADGSLHAPSPAGVDPDALPSAGEVSDTDRLLGFSEAGATVAVTAGQLKDYAIKGLATTAAMNAALDDKAAAAQVNAALSGKFGVLGESIDANTATQGAGYCYSNGSPTHGTVATFNGLLADGPYGSFQLFCDNQESNNARFWARNNNQQGFTPWRELWHSGNFDPSAVFRMEGNVPSSDLHNNEMAMLGNSTRAVLYNGHAGLLVSFAASASSSPLQLLVDSYASPSLKWRSGVDNSRFNDPNFLTIYDTGNLSPASASSVGLMSAEDKLRLNSVTSALSLGVEPLSAEETDAGVSPDVQVRARRSAQFQMQADEKLYDALEAFARNHPEYSEFAPWLAAKDQIRAAHPKAAPSQAE